MTALRLFDESEPAPKKKRGGRRLPNFLREAEVEHLFKTCQILIAAAKPGSKKTAAIRDELFVYIGVYMGLRVSEICSLQIEHLDFASRRCLVFQGKGSKDRYVPIHGKAEAIIKAWIGERRAGHVIITNRKAPLAVVTAEWRMARLGRLAGFGKKLKPHTLRHTAAIKLIESGASIHEVKEFLGHSNIAITDVYLHCTIEGLMDAVDRMK